MRAPQGVLVMRFSGSLLSSFILFVSLFSPFVGVLSQIFAAFLGLWKCGVTIAECAHVHSSAQPSWNVYNLPRTAAAEISTELDESWMCVCLRLILLQSLVSPAAPQNFLIKCSRGILFVCFLGVVPFVTRREILYWHVCPCSEYVLV